MCMRCSPSTRTSVALTWAVPVDILHLGPSLAAYDKVKPAITQLRLCHRFAQVSPLSKLPQELLDMIIDFMVAGEVPLHHVTWFKAKQCHDGECIPFDHFDEKSIEEFREEAWDQLFSDLDRLIDWDNEDEVSEAVDDIMLELAADHVDRWDICNSRTAKWSELIALGNPDIICLNKPKPSFEKYDKLLYTDFGLQVFIAQHTIPCRLERVFPANVGWRSRPHKETMAYLTLPCNNVVQDLYAQDSVDEWEYDYGFYNCTNISNIIDISSLTITNEQKQRFHKAMTFFDLCPKLYTIQVIDDADKDGPILTRKQKSEGIERGLAHQARENERLKKRLVDRVTEVERSAWPKLLNLVSVENKL